MTLVALCMKESAGEFPGELVLSNEVIGSRRNLHFLANRETRIGTPNHRLNSIQNTASIKKIEYYDGFAHADYIASNWRIDNGD